jgi:hypothetical protein
VRLVTPRCCSTNGKDRIERALKARIALHWMATCNVGMTGADVNLFCISCDVIQIRSEAKRPLIPAASAAACLVLEPSNPYDRNAVYVTSNDAKVGYLPRRIARSLQPMLADPKNIQWTVTLSVSDAGAADGVDEWDEAQAATAHISASAAESCEVLSLLRLQADTVVAAAAVKRLSPDELHSKFMRDSFLHTMRLHASSGSIISHAHAELASKLLGLDDAALCLLSRLMQRRSLWVQASALKLHPTSTSLPSLVSIGAVATTGQRMSPELALSLLPSLPLPILAKLSRAVNARQAASKRDVIREILNAACKQRTLFGGPMDVASAITRCLIDASPFICVLPIARTLCGRSASLSFLGVAPPPAVAAAITSDYDDAVSDAAAEGSCGRSPYTHCHAGCSPWFKLLPMIEMGMADRPCDLLASVCTLPPQPVVTRVLSDIEMSDCDFAKDCLDAAVWFGAKTATSNSMHSKARSALPILFSCATCGVRDYLRRHACISPEHRFLSCIFDLVPPPPPDFPCASSSCIDAHAFPPLPKALAAAAHAAALASSSSPHRATVSIAAAAAATRAFTLLNASSRGVDSPMYMLQTLPHMQPHYVSRFTSVYVYCKTLHSICPSLDTLGLHAEAVLAYLILLSLPYLRHRRAHWWTRLCINVENARFPLEVPAASLADAHGNSSYSALLRMCHGSASPPLSDSLMLCALMDDMVHEEDLYCLAQRAQRYVDSGKSSHHDKRSISSGISALNLPALTNVPEIIIEGRPSNRTAGQKSHFIGFDDSIGVSVEEFALQWCVRHAWGSHDGFVRSLFYCY